MAKKAPPHSIPSNIKKYRLLNHMTQEKLAELLCLDTQYYAQLERGERNFTIEKIISICHIFEIGIQDIIEIETEKDSDAKETLSRSITDRLQELNTGQLLLIEAPKKRIRRSN